VRPSSVRSNRPACRYRWMAAAGAGWITCSRAALALIQARQRLSQRLCGRPRSAARHRRVDRLLNLKQKASASGAWLPNLDGGVTRRRRRCGCRPGCRQNGQRKERCPHARNSCSSCSSSSRQQLRLHDIRRSERSRLRLRKPSVDLPTGSTSGCLGACVKTLIASHCRHGWGNEICSTALVGRRLFGGRSNVA
jgi:hypothetical protein